MGASDDEDGVIVVEDPAMISSRWQNHHPARFSRRGSHCAILWSLMSLVAFWFVCFVLLMIRSDQGGNFHPLPPQATIGVHRLMMDHTSGFHHERWNQNRPFEQELVQNYELGLVEEEQQPIHQMEQKQDQKDVSGKTANNPQPKIVTKSHLVSRLPNKVAVTSDVRGNLGPATVVIQAKPGTDWIHDRWQAASDMHGKQIPGEHWIQLEFEDTSVVADKIVLDWETAYADEYVLEASLEPNSDNPWILFDGRKPQDVASARTVTESGKSPGVKEPRPLHVIHTLELDRNRVLEKPFRYLRLRILKSITGWGVSLWQFDVHGFRADELQASR